MPGITDDAAMCTSAGQGLSWSGTEFSCTTAYSWKLTAAGGQALTIGSGDTVNFGVDTSSGIDTATGAAVNSVPAGLSVARSSGTINYSVKLGDGLRFDENGGIALKRCAAEGQVLKWDNTSHNWYCATYGGVNGIEVDTAAGTVGVESSRHVMSALNGGSINNIVFDRYGKVVTMAVDVQPLASRNICDPNTNSITSTLIPVEYRPKNHITGYHFNFIGFGVTMAGVVTKGGEMRFDYWMPMVTDGYNAIGNIDCNRGPVHSPGANMQANLTWITN
jgi:hypothetical protein